MGLGVIVGPKLINRWSKIRNQWTIGSHAEKDSQVQLLCWCPKHFNTLGVTDIFDATHSCEEIFLGGRGDL